MYNPLRLGAFARDDGRTKTPAKNEPNRVHLRPFTAVFLAFAIAQFGCGLNDDAKNGRNATALPPTGESLAIGGDWPVFRGNAMATGVADGELTNNPQLLWKFTVAKGSFNATPVVVGDTVYIGDLDGTFYAIDLTSGEQRWKFDLGADKAGFATAAVRDGSVYVGDTDGMFICLDAKTGEKKWTFKTDGEIDSAANFYRDKVLFGSQDATLYCLNAKTGELQWKHEIGDQIRCSPTVVEDRCFLAGCDGKLHVIDLANGGETGAVEIGSPTGCTPAAAGDRIYFGTEGATFFCVDWKTLKIVWQWTERQRSQSIRASAALTSDIVIVGGRDKAVHAFQPDAIQPVLPKWNFVTKGRVDSSPVIVGKRVYFGSSDGRIYGLDVTSGEKLWDYEAGGEFNAGPAIARGRLLIASSDGLVYCFGAK
ncbi:MAG TPA: PQQ-binding-like beta-propeller repeat protein [Pirellulales bacterium]